MDYIVGSVAALVSGNVTPNRPKFMKRALTPIKHQPSPNVTPKSELVEDRSIFLSPTMQKKKAIVKKSPKRIFQNPDLDITNDGEGNPNPKSPKADKVKKHLKEDLEADSNVLSPKSPTNKNTRTKESSLQINTNTVGNEGVVLENSKAVNESTPKKKKKRQNTVSENISDTNIESCDTSEVNKITENCNLSNENITTIGGKKSKMVNPSPKKMKITSKDSKGHESEKQIDSSYEKKLPSASPKKKKKLKEIQQDSSAVETQDKLNLPMNLTESSKIKSTGKKNKQKLQPENIDNECDQDNDVANQTDIGHLHNLKKKSKKRKNKKKTETNLDQDNEQIKVDGNKNISQKKKDENDVNPNAITNKDTDSEHESDDDIESENEQNNKEVLDTSPVEASSDEEEKAPKKQEKVEKKEVAVNTEEEVKRTLFVGNVPFSPKCKKELKKIFGKYGQIETVRIRTVPVKDGRMTPKLAVIRNELHPDRTTVNVYVKFRDASSVNEALVENGTVLNDHHLRVTRSDCTGSEHDPKCSVFVGNLPFALEDETLQQKFQNCGEIASVRIIRDRKTNAGKGFGYVNFKSKDSVELALALSDEDLTIKNRILRVKRCTQTTHKQRPQQDNRRGMYQGNYGRGNVQGRNHFGNRGENRHVGRTSYNNGQADGAMRRVMNKRKNQDARGEGPPDKRQRNIYQPGKKTRKEYVGMTAEKKKKSKFNKGQKKKKVLSEILTK